MSFVQLLGPTLKNNKGEDVTIEKLDKKCIGIYFSSNNKCQDHLKLIQRYESFVKDGWLFEIVCISSALDKASYNAQIAEMPWLILPFEENERAKKLGLLYCVQSCPFLAILDYQGQTITFDGFEDIKNMKTDDTNPPWEDYMEQHDPFDAHLEEISVNVNEDRRASTEETKFVSWQEDLLGKFVRKKEQSKIAIEELEGKAIGIYISAKWCPPCARFTPKLVKWYEQEQQAAMTLNRQCPIEIVNVSMDNNNEEFELYYSKMPWCTIPFSDEMRRTALEKKYAQGSIPTLVILDEKGETITSSGVQNILEGWTLHQSPSSETNMAPAAPKTSKCCSVS